MRRAYKYKLEPNANQERELCTHLETLRRVYNQALELKKTSYEQEKKSASFAELSRWFTAARRENPWYAQLNRNTAQSTLKRLDKAFQAFFRRVKSGEKPGYPRFKGRDQFESIEYLTPNNGYKLKDGRIYLQGIGDVKIRLHRPMEGKIKQVVVKREYAGRTRIVTEVGDDGVERRRHVKVERDKWFIIFSCDLGEVPVQPSQNPPVGIDVGIETFLTTSDGERVENPKYLGSGLAELRRKGRSVSRKKKGGTNRRKAVKALAKAHRKIRERRKDHHHKVANELVRRYGTIAVESLNIKRMLENGRLSRAISDAAWGGFLGTLRYKAESAGVSFVEVDAKGTSQMCSACGAEVPKTLSTRKHRCPCGCVLHRDENAARNILARGLLGRADPAGPNQGDGPDVPRNLPTFNDLSEVKPKTPKSRSKKKAHKGLSVESLDTTCLNDPKPSPNNNL